MATSFQNNLVAPLGAFLATGLLGVAQAAPATCANQEIVLEARQPFELDTRNNNAVLRDVVITQCDVRIRADEANIKGGLNFENSRWTIAGDVRITAEGGSLSSDKAVVSFRNKLISAATITGAPAQFEQKRDDGTMARGRANTIDYDTVSGIVSFNTDARLVYGNAEVTGQQFAYNIRAQRVEQPPASAPSGDGRIKFVFKPDKPAQITAPGQKKKEKKP